MKRYTSDIYRFEPVSNFYDDLPEVKGSLTACLAQLWEFDVYLAGAFTEKNGKAVYDFQLASELVNSNNSPVFFELDLTVVDNAGAGICKFIVEEVLS